MVFLLSDYLDDKSSVNLFNAQKSYRSMVQRFPKRYKKKKQIVLEMLKEELKKWNARIFCMNSNKTILFAEFDMEKWTESVEVSMKDGEVEVCTNECMLAWFKEERKYKTDSALLNAFKNYFAC